MKELKKNPIIFVPGLMGSFGGEMLLGRGPWTFGVANLIYKPLIKGLEDMGYRRDENLFICYYDWRKSIEDIVEEYFKPLLLEVRKKFPQQPLDVICHSMGGIVARGYLQREGKEGEIERLIMLGTPNKGAVYAYYFWSTGRLIKTKSLNGYIYRGYIWLLSKILNIPMGADHIEDLHNAFPAMKSLLPSSDYGDFLFYHDEYKKPVPISRRYIKYHNHYLDQLNDSYKGLFNITKEVYSIAGTEFETKEGLILDRKKLALGQEYIIDFVYTLEGDGTVTQGSAELNYSSNINIISNHHNIVKDSLPELGKIYGVELDADTPDLATLHIIFSGDLHFLLETEEEFVMDYSKNRIITNKYYIQQFHDSDYTWLAIVEPPKGEYLLKFKSFKQQSCKMLILGDGLEEDIEEMIEVVEGYHDGDKSIFFTLRKDQ
ncbi:lipase family alpha/beta hydrolase [Alkaliphilus serpentinus]|uniref:Lecithin:cholesterol acyltransferase n=1 Tax=Alkaliphilus serpentinus TaxID=1482731 RepID=A0A833HN54_9FIRM|nr:hypothetical protein [Alkaliphilus serpentinus]KAB3529150.1 hypothetical protein F8153_09945 [Alkaliphilus serpentinus]